MSYYTFKKFNDISIGIRAFIDYINNQWYKNIIIFLYKKNKKLKSRYLYLDLI